MNDTVIQVDAISKRYRLGVVGTGTLSHDLNRWWAQIRGKPDPYLKIGQKAASPQRAQSTQSKATENSSPNSSVLSVPSVVKNVSDSEDPDFVWALRDVSFEVKRGEVLGIIGRNGAGKSTLLKILSRVTAPTTGQIRVKGRIASLLEVGTGFHPELTGKENIFLNGAILGMTKSEIRSKLDEIIAFAEISKFIDTPVKRYSSGMYVRLAFAVAAHLDPEILIVDEVLAVGDAEFQKKCLGKMGEVAAGGRTVLFVSHNMAAIRNLCARTILIENGLVGLDGNTDHGVATYLGKLTQINTRTQSEKLSKHILSVSVLPSSGKEYLASDDSITIKITCNITERIVNRLRIGVGINDAVGGRILTLLSWNEGYSWNGISGCFEMSIAVDSPHLAPGWFNLKVALGDAIGDFDTVENACSFQIVPTDFFGVGKLPDATNGIVLARSTWQVTTVK